MSRLGFLGIPTGQRPVLLRRAIESFSRHFTETGSSVPICVFHSPRNAAEQSEVQSALRNSTGESGVAPVYVGIAEKVALAKLLRRATGVAPELLDFALFNPAKQAVATGANRNAILLWGAGARVLSADDDTTAQLSCHPDFDPALPLDPRIASGDVQDYFVPADGDLSTFALAANDPRFPRGGLPGALEAYWNAAARDGARPPLAFFGLAGDCAWGAPFGFWGESPGVLLLPTPSLERLAKDGVRWREVLLHRRLFRGAARASLTRGATGMTTSAGIDTGAGLPPFFPVGRGQDALFTALTERISGAPSLQIPLSIAHEPLEVRQFHQGELLRTAASLDISRVLFALLETAPASADLPAIGRHLAAHGALDDDQFAHELQKAHRSRMQRLVSAARTRASDLPQLSPEWHQDLNAYCAAVEQSVDISKDARELPWILDVGGAGARESIATARSLLYRYGNLCAAWPAILRASAERAQPSAGIPARASSIEPAAQLCSPYQTWPWRLHQLDPSDAAYIIFRPFRGEGPLNEDWLEEALRALVERHEALRCRIEASADQQPILDLRPAGELSLRRLPPLDAPTRALARSEESARPFDLSRELPIRIALVACAEAPGHWELWITVHHIAWDGFSEGIFSRELESIYANLEERRAPLTGIAPLEAGFREVARRQRRLSPDLLIKAERYWRNKLSGAPRELRVSHRPPPAARTSHAHRFDVALADELSSALRTLAVERRTTTAAICLAAWQALLHCFSGERDVVVAATFANRWDEAEEHQIGLFMTLLPTRVDLSGDPLLLEIARANQLAFADGFAHARLPIDQLIGSLAKASSGRRRFSMFQVLFTHVQTARAPSLGGHRMHPVERTEGRSGYDLWLTIEENAGKLRAVLLGNSGLFDAGDLERMGRALVHCLEQLRATADLRLSAIDWLGADRALLRSWNETTASYPDDQTLASLLRERALQCPDAVALESNGEELTYRELFRRADALAARLRTLGVGRDVRVAIYLDRHPRLLESLLAALIAGGGYLPLDPAFPPERLAFMLEDSSASVILTRRELVARLPSHRARVISVDDDAPTIQSDPPPPAGWRPADSSSLAYLLYTSGSTGKPKGVEIPHRALVNFLCSMRGTPGLAASDVLLAVTTISFDIAGLELWLPLLVGARIFLGRREEAADGKLLGAALRKSRATVLQATPTTWRLLLETDLEDWSHLKALVGGEALPPDLAAQLGANFAEAWNMYGPTETTVWSTVWRIPKTPAPVRIGRPIANTQIHILDEHLREVPIGVTGELYIGGDGVARGYLNRPQLDAERFISDPLATNGSGRIYRTGDRARWLPDGNIECLGRNDDQIKLRGFRIEPGEIEAALLHLPEVAHAAVALHETVPGESRLVAYLVLQPGAALPASPALRTRLRNWLLEHMLPYHFIAVEKLPLTPNGKVDRRALSAFFHPPAEEPRAAEQPTTPEEVQLLAEFSRLLRRPAGLDTDFFEGGGDSLGAVQLLARIAATHPVVPTTGDLFLHSTPRLLASLLRTLATATTPRAGHLVPMRREGSRPPLIFLHPIGGQLAAYGRLVLHLSGSGPLYGLLGATQNQREYHSFAERCSVYAKEIREVTRGPVVLAGYSLGGQLALETASQLRRQGHRVSLVILFDAAVPRPPFRLPGQLLFRARELRRFSWQERAIWARSKLANALTPEDVEPIEGTELIDAAESARLGRQALSWQVPRYDGPVLLFRAAQHPRGYSNPPGSLGWDRTCTNLRVISLPCDHSEMMREPHVERMSKAILAQPLDEL